MRNLIERIEDVMDEAKKPFALKSFDEKQAVQVTLHMEVAAAARAVLKAATLLHQAVARGADTGAGTFQETRDSLWKMDIIEAMTKIATDHTRWAKTSR